MIGSYTEFKTVSKLRYFTPCLGHGDLSQVEVRLRSALDVLTYCRATSIFAPMTLGSMTLGSMTLGSMTLASIEVTDRNNPGAATSNL